MKLHADRLDGQNAIARHGPGGVLVNQTEHTRPVIVPWQGPVLPWDVASFDTLAAAHFEPLLALKPQLVLFGSGARLRFPPPRLLAGLMAARIGFEAMDTAAACRTYNVLLAEGREVVAALLFDPAPGRDAPR
ncbi:Mth938-like domain-containing protein [Piscinibacter sakaiensis]|uniref:Membrane protein n=1 Tax=Piscinibacter sakaiensis TaxID=1547922 RepID=A0A0K8NYT1_PISS1|nr:Mth938-like domain-containing protein [Piscinibacter sakaiensis]GAP35533.1 membrane protein [Piscinibacter sakaiensis]